MNEIELSEFGSTKSLDTIREIAEGINPGKGILLTDVAAEIELTPNSVRIHAKRLGCYQILNVKGKPTAFITSLKP